MESISLGVKHNLKGIDPKINPDKSQKKVMPVGVMPMKHKFIKNAGIVLGAAKILAKNNLRNAGMYSGAIQGAMQSSAAGENATSGALRGASRNFNVVPLGKSRGLTYGKIKNNIIGNRSATEKVQGRFQNSEKLSLKKNQIASMEE